MILFPLYFSVFAELSALTNITSGIRRKAIDILEQNVALIMLAAKCGEIGIIQHVLYQ